MAEANDKQWQIMTKASLLIKGAAAFLLNKNYYLLIIILFWAVVGHVSSGSRVKFYKEEVRQRAEDRGQLLHQVILTSHAYTPLDVSYRGESFDRSFIKNLTFDHYAKINYNFENTTYRIITTFPTKGNYAVNDAQSDWLQDPDVVSNGRMEINFNDPSSLAVYTKPVITIKSCVNCHQRLGMYDLKLGEIQMEVITAFSIRDFLSEYKKNMNNNIATDIIICSVLALLTIITIHILKSYYTKLQATTSQMIEREKLASLGSMVAGFSHELKTPIGIAVAAASQISETLLELQKLVKQDEVSEDEVIEQMTTLSESSQLISTHLSRAHNMISELKGTASDLSLEEKKIVVLHDLFNDIETDMRHMYKSANLNIYTRCPPKLNMYTSAGSLKQIMYNLYNNAIKYAFSNGKTPGTITIDCALVDGQLKINFSDDGRGMESAHIKHLFEPFYTTGREDGGTGLGLFIVYTIVTNDLNGTVKCISKPGGGTRFEITLPYTRREKAAEGRDT